MAESELSLPTFLKSQLKAGRVIPFLGAGISMNAGLPDWPGLLERLVTEPLRYEADFHHGQLERLLRLFNARPRRLRLLAS